MADTRTPDQRRRIMQSVGVRDTGPERIVRSALHKAGFRFRLHRRDLPGKPDIVLPAKRLVVFVHGCFWHGHGCAKGKLPKSRLEYWRPKIAANAERDQRNVRDLAKLGWKSLIVWQCETSDVELAEKLRRKVMRRS